MPQRQRAERHSWRNLPAIAPRLLLQVPVSSSMQKRHVPSSGCWLTGRRSVLGERRGSASSIPHLRDDGIGQGLPAITAIRHAAAAATTLATAHLYTRIRS